MAQENWHFLIKEEEMAIGQSPIVMPHYAVSSKAEGKSNQGEGLLFLMVTLEKNVLGFIQIVHARGYLISGQGTIF